MQPQADGKPLPSVELSLKYMSWSVKEGVVELRKMQAITDQKLSEIVSQIRELHKTINTIVAKREPSPF